jgi:PAS domain S-box-containing protein
MMEDQTLQVLVVEDNPTDVFLLKKALQEVATFKIVLTQAKRLDEALHCLHDKSIDVVFLDLGLPDSQGLETFNRMQRDYSEVPILILSGLDNESLSVQAVQNGAQDFLVKGGLSGKTLARTIRYAIERKRSEQRLIASEAGYRRLFETAHDGIFILNADSGQITDTNPYLEEMLGYKRAELVGKRLWEIAPFRDQVANQVAFRTLQEKGYIRYDDLPLAAKDGRFIDVEFVSNVYDVGSKHVIQCNISDITERKRAEAAEMDLQRFLQSTIDALPAHLAVLDETGRIIAVNQAWRQFSDDNEGTAASCGVGANYVTVCEKASGRGAEEGLEVSQGIQSVLTGQHEAFCLEYPCHSPTEERWFSVCVTPFAGEGPVRVVVAHENITTRAKAENLISTSEANLAKSQQMAHLGSWELDLSNLDDINANPLRWSDEIFRILGYAPGEFEPSNEAFFRAVHPDDRALLSRMMAEAVAGGEPYSVEHRIVLPDGRERVVHAQSEIIYNEETGQPVKIIGLGQDITERKQAEERLYRSEANLATAQQMARLGSWEWELTPHEDWRKNRVHWSDEVFRIFGYAPDAVEASFEIFKQALHPEDCARIEDITGQALLNRSGYKLEHRVLLPDGTERIVHEQAELIFDVDGKPLRVVGTVQDITERKQAEEALQRNETKFRTIFETALDAILLANDDGNYVDANPAACALLGYEHGQLMGRTIADLVSPATRDAVRAAWKDFLRDGQQSGEFEFQQPDGTHRQAEFRAVAGLQSGVHMAMLRDITERKLAEATLVESEARFRTAISEAPVPIMIHREDGKVLQISKGWTKYSGYELEDVPTIQIGPSAPTARPVPRPLNISNRCI